MNTCEVSRGTARMWANNQLDAIKHYRKLQRDYRVSDMVERRKSLRTWLPFLPEITYAEATAKVNADDYTPFCYTNHIERVCNSVLRLCDATVHTTVRLDDATIETLQEKIFK